MAPVPALASVLVPNPVQKPVSRMQDTGAGLCKGRWLWRWRAGYGRLLVRHRAIYRNPERIKV